MPIEFKLDSNIPIPERTEFDVEDIAPDEVVSRWQPFRARTGVKPCANDKHRSDDKGRCDICGDIFPCPSGNCGHVDCFEAGNGTDLPDWVKEAMCPATEEK